MERDCMNHVERSCNVATYELRDPHRSVNRTERLPDVRAVIAATLGKRLIYGLFPLRDSEGLGSWPIPLATARRLSTLMPISAFALSTVACVARA
jgi:hypothetical protein